MTLPLDLKALREKAEKVQERGASMRVIDEYIADANPSTVLTLTDALERASRAFGSVGLYVRE